MRGKIADAINAGKRFRKEFRRQLRSFVIIALAFTVAFSWRQTTFDISQNIVKFITKIESSSATTIITSTFITVVCVILIYATSYALRDSPENFI